MSNNGTMDSLCMRVLLFFLDVPDEQLTSADIRSKFGMRIRNMRRTLQPLVDRGVLSVQRCGPNVPDLWSAGPKLKPLCQCEVAACKPKAL